MTKRIKKLFTALLAGCALVAFLLFGTLSFNSNKGYAADAVSFGVLNEADFRLPASGEDQNLYGLRFYGRISKAQYQANAEQGAVVYGLQITADDLGEAGAKDVSSQSLKVTFDGEVGTFKGSIVRLKRENYTRAFMARAYYQIGNGERVYSEWSRVKTLFGMATQAVQCDLGERAQTVETLIDEVTNPNNEGYYYVKELDLSKTQSLVSGESVAITATMTNGANQLEVYPKVSLTSPTDIPLSFGEVSNNLVQDSADKNVYTVAFNAPTNFKVGLSIGKISKTISCTMADTQNAYRATVEGNKITLKTGSTGLDTTVTQDKAGNVIGGEGSCYKGEYRSDYSFYGLGEYKVGQTLSFYFTGKNIPNLAILADSNNGQAIGGGKGIFLRTSSSGGVTNGRFYIAAGNRIDSGNVNDYGKYASNDDIIKNQAYATNDFSNTGNTSLLGFNTLEDGVNYKYTVKTADAGANVAVTASIFNADTNSLIKELSYSVPYTVPEKTYAVVYGTTNGADITFTYDFGGITLVKGSRNYTATIPELYTTDFSSASYQIGLYESLKVTYTGKNIPNVVAMSTTNGGQILDASLNGYAFIAAQAQNKNRFHASGYTRAAIDTSNKLLGRNQPAEGGLGMGTALQGSAGDNKDLISYGDMVDGVEYVLTISTTATAVTYDLSSGGKSMRAFTYEYAKTGATDMFANGNERYFVMLYGNDIADITLDSVEVVSNRKAISNKNANELLTATSGYYYLTEDIDLTGATNPANHSFNGVLDGQGYSVKNIPHAINNGGLFDTLSSATVCDLVLIENAGGTKATGILCNTLKDTKISNVVVKANANWGATTNTGNPQYGGALCRDYQGGCLLKDVIIYLQTGSADNSIGFIGGMTADGSTVTLNNCYFIANDLVLANGLRTNKDSYIGVKYDATDADNGLCTSASDTRYSRFFQGEYEVYQAADIATAYSNFQQDENKYASAKLQALATKAGLVMGKTTNSAPEKADSGFSTYGYHSPVPQAYYIDIIYGGSNGAVMLKKIYNNENGVIQVIEYDGTSKQTVVKATRYSYDGLQTVVGVKEGATAEEDLKAEYGELAYTDFRTKDAYTTYKEAGLDTLFIQENDAVDGSTTTLNDLYNTMDTAKSAGINKVIVCDRRLVTLSRFTHPLTDAPTEEERATYGMIFAYQTGYFAAHTEQEFATVIKNALKQYIYKDNFFGIMLADEPDYTNIEQWALVYKLVKQQFPVAKAELEAAGKTVPVNQIFIQANLLPGGSASPERLAELNELYNNDEVKVSQAVYREYVDTYFTISGADMATVDTYPVVHDGTQPEVNAEYPYYIGTNHFYGLSYLAEKGKQTGASLGGVAISNQYLRWNGNIQHPMPNEDYMFYQINSYMMFGAKSLGYYCYWARTGNSWQHPDGSAFIGRDGEPTELYPVYQRVTAYAKEVADYTAGYSYNGYKYYTSGTANPYLSALEEGQLASFSGISSGSVTGGKEVLITEFNHDVKANKKVYGVMNTVIPDFEGDAVVGGESVTVRLTVNATEAYLLYEGALTKVEVVNGVISLTIPSGHAYYLFVG